MSGFPHLVLRGTPRARGLAYGEAFRERIRATHAFYAREVFALSPLTPVEIERRAARVRELIGDFEPAYATEIEAIAEGAGLAAWQVYCLNARTEILNAAVGECTALYFAQARVLGQTWDWLQELEDLCVVTTSERPDGHRILAFAEPGMLAKIGMNGAGLGVCLNFLVAPHALDGVPVHVLVRAILDAPDIDAARAVIARSGHGKASNFLLGDAMGRGISIEFAGDVRAELAPQAGVLAHTNHCVSAALADRTYVIPTSPERLARAGARAAAVAAQSVASMQALLGDTGEGPGAITVRYRPEPLLGGKQVGSCATVVMDLPARVMHLRKGPDPARPFQAIALCADAGGDPET